MMEVTCEHGINPSRGTYRKRRAQPFRGAVCEPCRGARRLLASPAAHGSDTIRSGRVHADQAVGAQAAGAGGVFSPLEPPPVSARRIDLVAFRIIRHIRSAVGLRLR